jgi:adenosyl cobinamide kinase/adenosyl cobinamide phosphate guanylyltransferase
VLTGRTLVLGGVRSGKSVWAERLLADAPVVSYVATAAGRDDDPDWSERIGAHRRRRPAHWSTVEAGGDPALLVTALKATTPLLVDDIGNWLTAALDAAGGWDHGAQAVDGIASALVDAVAGCAAPVVLVSPEVGWGVLPATRAGRIFADAQGQLNQRLAAVCDQATLVVAGLPIRLK